MNIWRILAAAIFSFLAVPTLAAPYQVNAAGTYFTQSSGALFGGAYLTDSVFMRSQGVTRMFYNCTSGGVQNRVCGQIVTGASWTSAPSTAAIFSDVCRFPHVFNDNNGNFYMTCNKGSQGAGDVYLYKSTNGGATWAIANGGNAILTQQAGTNWAYIWNTSIQVVGDTWVLLAETSAIPSRMDLSLATAQMTNGTINFNPGKVQDPVIVNGGNSEITLMPDGKTLVATHGLYQDGRYNGAWYITISTATIDNLTQWTTHRDGFNVGEPGIDIADPTTLDMEGNRYIVFSYNQNQLRMINANIPIIEVYNRLLGR